MSLKSKIQTDHCMLRITKVAHNMKSSGTEGCNRMHWGAEQPVKDAGISGQPGRTSSSQGAKSAAHCLTEKNVAFRLVREDRLDSRATLIQGMERRYMKRDMLVKVTEDSFRCRICELHFVPAEPNSSKMHKENHKKLARGGLPLGVREFLNTFGWAVTRNCGGIDRLKEAQNGEIGKLAVAYSRWTRARMNGIDESEFDEYMSAHIHIIDSIVEGNAGKIDQAFNQIKRWERFAG